LRDSTPHPSGGYFVFELLWRGVAYGVDALLLSVFPGLIAWELMQRNIDGAGGRTTRAKTGCHRRCLSALASKDMSNETAAKRWCIIAVPPILKASMYGAFRYLTARFGFPYPGGTASFTGYSVVLGLSYAYYARRTGSIRLCIVSHCIPDALGSGAFAYASWLT
jgi:hypothetical protein